MDYRLKCKTRHWGFKPTQETRQEIIAYIHEVLGTFEYVAGVEELLEGKVQKQQNRRVTR